MDRYLRERDEVVVIRRCKICRAPDNQDARVAWVRPCHCIGFAEWAHVTCFKRMLLRRHHLSQPMFCLQCFAPFRATFPPMSRFAQTVKNIKMRLKRLREKVNYLLNLLAIYWCALSFGGLVCWLAMAGEQSFRHYMLNSSWYVMTLLWPIIPAALLCYQLFYWEHRLVCYVHRTGLIDKIFNFFTDKYPDLGPLPSRGTLYLTRVIFKSMALSAFTMPFIAYFWGITFFASSAYPMLSGCLISVVLKGIWELYVLYLVIKNETAREVQNFDPNHAQEESLFDRVF